MQVLDKNLVNLSKPENITI